MTQPDFRAELQLLVNASNQAGEDLSVWWDAVDRAEAALATPPPEPPTDEEIKGWADACSEAPLEEMDPEIHGWRRCFTSKEFSETIRAALERWGHR
jgi:hypothetical protein